MLTENRPTRLFSHPHLRSEVRMFLFQLNEFKGSFSCFRTISLHLISHMHECLNVMRSEHLMKRAAITNHAQMGDSRKGFQQQDTQAKCLIHMLTCVKCVKGTHTSSQSNLITSFREPSQFQKITSHNTSFAVHC